MRHPRCPEVRFLRHKNLYKHALNLRTLTLLLFIFSCTLVNSQTILTLQPHTGVQFKSTDIWNMNVVYTQSNSVKVQFQAELRFQGKLVERLSTFDVVLKQGVNSYSSTNIRTQNQTYLNPELGKVERKLGYLPDGNYEYCIRLVCRETPDQCEQKLGQEVLVRMCMDVEAKTSTPLLLTLPEDEAILEDKRPSFSWIAPMPIGSDADFRYQMKLVKLNKNQSAEDGIQRNRVLFRSTRQSSLQLMLPVQIDDLEEGERYAWLVEGYLGNMFIARSEVWEFEIKKKPEKAESFVRVRFNDPETHVCSNTLRFIYKEEYVAGNLDYVIFDSEGNDVTTNEQFNTAIGENKYEILIEDKGFVSGEIYTLIITDRKNRKLKLNFTYSNE